MSADLVPVEAGLVAYGRAPATELQAQSREIRELQRAVLVEGTDFGNIPGTKKPTLFKSGAEWLLKWGRFGHRLDKVDVERDGDGRPYGVTYRCTIHHLLDKDVVVATCDGYAGYDEPDREAHTNKWGKPVARAPWNTIIKMAQKRALVGATLQATSSSGLFSQDMEDYRAADPATGEIQPAKKPRTVSQSGPGNRSQTVTVDHPDASKVDRLRAKANNLAELQRKKLRANLAEVDIDPNLRFEDLDIDQLEVADALVDQLAEEEPI